MECSSGKVLYYSRAKAKRATKIIKAAGNNRVSVAKPASLRPYLCRECGLWHLTSQRR